METDTANDSTDLFASVLGGLSKEQWDEYKLQKKLEGGLTAGDDEEEEEEENNELSDKDFLSDSRSCSPCDFPDELVTKIDIVQKEDSESSSEAASSDDETDLNYKEWTGEAAVKYVNGEIDISTLAQVLETTSKKTPKKRTADDAEHEDETVKKKRKPRRRIHELPREFKGLMGTANGSFAAGNYEDAIQKCMQIIEAAPFAQEPYVTLSCIYEEMGDAKKSLQCALGAAYLNPSDTSEWIRLAHIAMEQSQLQQAVKCLSLAIRNEPKNIDLLWQRCNLYEQLGERKNALAGYELILQNLSNQDDGEKCIQLARDIAKLHHTNEDATNAIRILESAFTKFPALVTSEDINMLLEHLMNEKMYRTALKNIVLHCGVALLLVDSIIDSKNYTEVENEEIKEINRCTYPSHLHIDLMAKLLVCLIYVKAVNAIEELITRLKEESPEDVGDLYLDAAEALMDVGEFSTAKQLLQALVNSQKFNAAGVWLKYADCLKMLSEYSEATDAYERVLQLAPSYQEARIPLSGLLINAGDQKAAAEALKQDGETGDEDAVVDLNVLVRRADILYDLQCHEEFIVAAKLSLFSHCIPVRTNEEIISVINTTSYRRRRELLRELPSITNQKLRAFENCDVSMEKLWDIFYKLCRILFNYQRFSELHSVTLMAMTSNQWRKSVQHSKDVDMLALLGCYFNNSHKYAYLLIRELILKDIKKNKPFNLLCLNVLKTQQIRHHRFCLRLMAKHTVHTALGLFNGHSAMISGSYKLALGEYVNLLKKMPDDPLINFYVGITYVHLASQKFATRRYFLIVQGIAFLQKYISLRKASQEALYNLGRAYHQLGIKDAAVFYYKKALETPSALVGTKNEELFDLRHEIAFNLALIYQSSEEYVLANMYLRTYCII